MTSQNNMTSQDKRSPSLKSLAATVALIVWIIVYALAVIFIMGTKARHFGPWGELAFYVVGGLGWVPVAMFIISFMKPKKQA